MGSDINHNESPNKWDNFKADFISRCKATRTTRRLRFAFVALLWIAFCIWMENAWLLLVLPLLLDIYITGYIPFTWWKHSKNKLTRLIMSWVDAIVYALILVYFIFNFIGQNYQIPSSSLEKTLLTGDYLFVDKVTYGPRVPMTPIHFPLVHNSIFNCKSYLEWPQNGYHRLKGLRNVELGDIVVFNFPAGDTVMTNFQNPDYYQLVAKFGYYNVNNNPQFGEKITRPVDRRENYVKRAVGLPGQRLKVVDGEVWTDGVKQKMPENAQFRYFVQSTGSPISNKQWEDYGVTIEDIYPVPVNGIDAATIIANGFSVKDDGSVPPIYDLPMTRDMIKQMKADGLISSVQREPATNDDLYLFPFEMSKKLGWTRSDYGGDKGILIPKKGLKIALNHDNWLLYERCIRVYEGNSDAQWRNGHAYINGKVADYYTFNMDYYFMMGDNRDCSLDSRYWGFVPEDHIVGTPRLVLISFDKDKSIFSGGIRWNRVFRIPNPDK
jgi:signal peptidase I